MRLKVKNSAIRELIAPISVNKITGTTIDFKMGVIKNSFGNFFSWWQKWNYVCREIVVHQISFEIL